MKTEAAPKAGDFQIERPDWTLFRSIATLGQKAGVPPSKLRRLALKELTDNALDTGARARANETEPGCYVIQDNGPGIDGPPEKIARLFSIDRGTRVIESLAQAAAWRAWQWLAGRRRDADCLGRRLPDRHHPRPAPYHHAAIRRRRICSIRVRRLSCWNAHRDFVRAVTAERPRRAPMGGHGDFDGGGRHRLLRQVFRALVRRGRLLRAYSLLRRRPVRDLIANLDGCTGAKAGVIASDFLQRPCASLTREETTELLLDAQSATTPPSVKRLGAVGEIEGLPAYHATERGFVTLGAREPQAHLPFVVEAWAERAEPGYETEIEIYVNRTPITGEATIFHNSKELSIYGCGLNNDIDTPTKKGAWTLALNITAPFVPITTDGKEPDLDPFADYIVAALSSAIKKAHRNAPKAASHDGDGILPTADPGSGEAYRAKLREFCDKIRKIDETLDYKVSSRGWCYILEEHGLGKDQFQRCQNLINDCRKNGMLPFDLCAPDPRRAAEEIEGVDDPDLDAEAESALQNVREWHEDYRPSSFWDTVDAYIEMAVEKVDLKSLFGPICLEHHVPISNKAGWGDINSRCSMMLRFKEMEAKGKACALLYCGDFDPGGLNISDFLHKNFADLAGAVGWSPRNLVIERFGLNEDFIKKHGLTWIDNLKTGGGKLPLDDPRHPDHNKAYVQEYLRKYGARKVEANALVVRPEAGRQLCRDTLARFIDLDALAAYEAEIAEQREQLRLKIEAVLKRG